MLNNPVQEGGLLSPLSEAQLEVEFAKIKPLMTHNEAVIEASRCLFCHDAPCVVACPTSIDIPMFIRQISTQNITGSARTIFTQNIMGKSCGEVCPTQVLCEGSCVYHDLNEKPIDIGRLQAFATNTAIDKDLRFFHPGPKNGKRVAVIGGGPAGLACAHELTVLGYDAVVYEASDEAGGLNRYGVAPYKFNNADAAKEVAYVKGIGFEVKTNTRVVTDNTASNGKKAIPLAQLEQEFDAVFLGLGLGASHKLEIPGEKLPQVYGAAEFIYALRDQDLKVPVGQRVVVIGGGNTGVDAAVESAKLGADVTMVYRRGAEDMSAYDFEIHHAKEQGVKVMLLSSPLEIVGTAQVEGLKCIQNKVGQPDASGKSGIEAVAGSEFVIPCDMVIAATGQEKQATFFEQIGGLTLDRGKVKVNPSFQTTNPKYFAGGDCVNGGKEVVNAVAHGRDAARGIHQYLTEGV